MSNHAEAPPRSVPSLTESAARLVEAFVPGCEGACLGASAILARVLADHGVMTTAVRGTYDGLDHWWLETDTLRIDVTRGQFERTAPLVETLTVPSSHVGLERFQSGWSHEQAVQEFSRMFEYPVVGADCGEQVLDDLSDLAEREFRP